MDKWFICGQVFSVVVTGNVSVELVSLIVDNLKNRVIVIVCIEKDTLL